MFTIKWIASNGYEHLYRGSDVRFVPESTAISGKRTVEFDLTGQTSNIEGDSRCIIDEGRVFVMNETGKTIADYHLDS